MTKGYSYENIEKRRITVGIMRKTVGINNKSIVTKAKSIGYSTLGIGYMRKSAGYCTKRTKHGLSSEKNKQVEFDPFRYEISPMALDQLEFSIRESLTHILTTGIK